MGIGPSTKETTLHHFQDPLLAVLDTDNDIDLVGIVIVGTPQEQVSKYFVGDRAASLISGFKVDGVLFSVDGWGNSHVDYAHTFEAIGKCGIPIVGLSFVGTQAEFVVKNKYMTHIVDINKSLSGTETEVLGENSLTILDAKKALAMLKLIIRGKNEIY